MSLRSFRSAAAERQYPASCVKPVFMPIAPLYDLNSLFVFIISSVVCLSAFLPTVAVPDGAVKYGIIISCFSSSADITAISYALE